MSQRFILGATTVGVVCKDGVILSSEKRVAYGYMVMSKMGRKIFKITDTIGAACAGLVADMQILIRQVGAYSKLFELEHNRKISVRTTAKTISNLLFQRRLFPYITQTIIGGIDDEGPNLYVLDPLGSLIPDKYATVGTGAEIAVGVLEAGYKEGLTLQEGRDLVFSAMKSALARDIASGDGVDILIISKDGIKEESIVF
ncbi:MAG: archaeal proteasome endopeptidase complex subunit beta [Candidatus Bathyarchaeia archaeon]